MKSFKNVPLLCGTSARAAERGESGEAGGGASPCSSRVGRGGTRFARALAPRPPPPRLRFRFVHQPARLRNGIRTLPRSPEEKVVAEIDPSLPAGVRGLPDVVRGEPFPQRGKDRVRPGIRSELDRYTPRPREQPEQVRVGDLRAQVAGEPDPEIPGEEGPAGARPGPPPPGRAGRRHRR